MPKLIIGGKNADEWTDAELLQALATMQGKRVEEVVVKAKQRQPRTAKEIKKYDQTPLTEL